jgi:quinol monooxygenase YgiN
MTLLDDILHRIPETGEVNIVATRKGVPGKQEEFEELLKEMESGTLANDQGCLRHEWYRSDAPHTYILVERWADRAAVLTHQRASHMVAIKSRMAAMVVGDLTFANLSRM